MKGGARACLYRLGVLGCAMLGLGCAGNGGNAGPNGTDGGDARGIVQQTT